MLHKENFMRLIHIHLFVGLILVGCSTRRSQTNTERDGLTYLKNKYNEAFIIEKYDETFVVMPRFTIYAHPVAHPDIRCTLSYSKDVKMWEDDYYLQVWNKAIRDDFSPLTKKYYNRFILFAEGPLFQYSHKEGNPPISYSEALKIAGENSEIYLGPTIFESDSTKDWQELYQYVSDVRMLGKNKNAHNIRFDLQLYDSGAWGNYPNGNCGVNDSIDCFQYTKMKSHLIDEIKLKLALSDSMPSREDFDKMIHKH